MKMNNSSIYYQRNKERLLEKAQNLYYHGGGVKKVFQNKPEVNIDNYLMKKRI